MPNVLFYVKTNSVVRFIVASFNLLLNDGGDKLIINDDGDFLEVGGTPEEGGTPPAGPEEVTYYFDGYDAGEAWPNSPENMVDGTFLASSVAAFQMPDSQLLNSNTCGGTNLGTITKVEIRVHGRSGWAGTGWTHWYIQPIFTGGNGDQHNLIPTNTGYVPYINETADWGAYIDITSDTNAPGTWSWSDVQSMNCRLSVDMSTAAPLDSSSIGKIEIQVTYTP